MIGEFLEAPDLTLPISVPRYGTETIPARRVQWFAPVDEGLFSPDLTVSLRSPNPFTLLGRQYREAVLGHSYGTYYTVDEYVAQFLTRSQDFEPYDGYNFNVLALLASALCSLQASEDPADVLEGIEQAIRLSVGPEYRPSVSYNIHSPGEISVRASTPVPVLLAALFALFLAGSAEGASLPSPDEVTVVNSLSTASDDLCLARIKDSVRTALTMMGMKMWEAGCSATRELAEAPKLTAEPKVVIERPTSAGNQTASPPIPRGRR
jgi:hypothetical protein